MSHVQGHLWAALVKIWNHHYFRPTSDGPEHVLVNLISFTYTDIIISLKKLNPTLDSDCSVYIYGYEYAVNTNCVMQCYD